MVDHSHSIVKQFKRTSTFYMIHVVDASIASCQAARYIVLYLYSPLTYIIARNSRVLHRDLTASVVGCPVNGAK